MLYWEWKKRGWSRKAFLSKPHRKLTQEGEGLALGRSWGRLSKVEGTRSAKVLKLDKPGVFLELGKARVD